MRIIRYSAEDDFAAGSDEQKVGRLYRSYMHMEKREATAELNVNSEFTLGENIEYLGRISIALKAYQLSLDGKEAPVLDGFTVKQRVFLGFGQVWLNKYRDEALRSQIETAPHSPSSLRANGSVRNIPEFYKAFDVNETNALYLPPEERVKIW
jgi:putative endopeptidase